MASGVQDITCVFVEVVKKTLILQCPGIVCSPPVVSKCLGEAHRRLELFTLHYIRLGHVNKINCFSSFCLQKFGEEGGYLLFIFRGQRSYAARCETGIYKRRVKGKPVTTQVKKE